MWAGLAAAAVGPAHTPLPMQLNPPAQEQLQERGGKTAGGSCSSSAPAASCPPGGGVRGGTAWPDPLHHHWSAIFATHLRSLCPPSQGSKVSESFSVWSWGCCRVRVAAGRGSSQAGRRRRLYISAASFGRPASVDWYPTPPGFLAGIYE